MKQKLDDPAILHHKYSLEDGHVTAQISKVKGYRGIMLTRGSGQRKDHSPFSSFMSVEEIEKHPELLKQMNIAGVHIHHGTLATKFQYFKTKYGLPLFVGFRGKDATAFPKKKENLLKLQEVFRNGDLFFPVCKHLKRQIIELGCPKRKIRVLYGGVDLHRFENRPRVIKDQENIRFLAIGRFVEKKGFAELIRAFARVKKSMDQVKLVLIGTGPCEAEYRKLIKKHKLQDSVQLVPWVKYGKIQKEYYRSHIFCAPSCTDQNGNQEGIPNTLKEAMATGMPVISTKHAGIPELVKHKVSGLLVPERSVGKLAKAMLWMADHPEKWGDLGQQARAKVEKDFNLELQLEKQRKWYDEVLKGKK